MEIPKATHSGFLKLGEMEISCAVLSDGTALINQISIQKALGRSHAGGGRGRKPQAILDLEKERGGEIPSFLAVSNLIPFMSNELRCGGEPIFYKHPKQGKSKGFKADIIPQICEAYLSARESGVLTDVQKPIAARAELIMRGLARVGISALIYEVTGYEKDKEIDSLRQILDQFILKELQPWTKRFPDIFFQHIKRMYGLEHLNRCPSFCGHLINRYVYNEISPEVLEELKRINPIMESGHRKHKHHQFLTKEIGHPALDKQVIKVITLMSICDSIDEFDEVFERSKLRL